MTAPRYSPDAVRAICEALGRPANAHDYALTDAATGRVKGVYATEALAVTALARLATSPGVYVLTVLHPAACVCPEVG